MAKDIKKLIKKVANDEVDLSNIEEITSEGEESEEEEAPEEAAADEGEISDESEDASDEAAAEGDDEIPDVTSEEIEAIADDDEGFEEEAPEEAAGEGSEESSSEEAPGEAAASDENGVNVPEAGQPASPTPGEVLSEGEEIEEDPASDEAAAEGDDEISEELPEEAAGEGEEDSEDEAAEADAEDADEMIVEPITEAEFDEKSAEFEFVLCNASTKNPHWMVMANGEPYAKIALLDQDDADMIKESFVSDGYAVAMKESIESCGAKDVLKNVKARYYAAMVRKADVVKAIQAETEQKVTANLATANDSYNEKLADNMLLVLKAETKNFFPNVSPFKAALIHAFKKAGVEGGKEIVEATFLNHGEEFFQRIMNKAAEWCAYTGESMKELRASIEGMNHKEAEYDQEEMKHEAAEEKKTPPRGVALASYGTKPTGQKTAATGGGDTYRERVSASIRGMRIRGR